MDGETFWIVSLLQKERAYLLRRLELASGHSVSEVLRRRLERCDEFIVAAIDYMLDSAKPPTNEGDDNGFPLCSP